VGKAGSEVLEGSIVMKDDDFLMGEKSFGEERAKPRLLKAVVDALVSARGTADGLTIRLDARADAEVLKQALLEFVESRRSFLKGNEVALEWVGKSIDEILLKSIKQELLETFDIVVTKSVLQGSADAFDNTAHKDEGHARRDMHDEVDDGEDIFASDGKKSRKSLLARIRGNREKSRTASLFDGVEVYSDGENSKNYARSGLSGKTPGYRGDDLRGENRIENRGDTQLFEEWDDADARIIFQTLRGGQKVETEHSLVICGDVNSGAEVVAGGDIIVLGTLRGVAHAGAYDETGGGRFIFSLDLRPTQLRIGRVISRGSTDVSKKAEIARVEGNVIVVEPYQSRARLARGTTKKSELSPVRDQFEVE
jgi:septum site-determining protein MinC